MRELKAGGSPPILVPRWAAYHPSHQDLHGCRELLQDDQEEKTI